MDEEPKTKSGEQLLDLRANFHDFSEKTNVKLEINNDNDEAVQDFDNFDDFSEVKSKTEFVEEDVKANNLKDDPEFDEKHDPLTTKSAKEEENPNKEDLDGVANLTQMKYPGPALI